MTAALLILLGVIIGAAARKAAPPALAVIRTTARAIERRVEGAGRHTRVRIAEEVARCT